jgi:uncharacterized protein (TIGR03083 family)
VPQTTPDRATILATAEYEALLALLRALSQDDWLRGTDCTGWTVRDVVAHVVGALDEGAHLPTFVRHALTAWRRYRRMPMLDGINEAQIDDRRRWSGPQLVTDLAQLVAGGVHGRRRVPGLVRRISLPTGGPLPAGARLSYLFDVIYTRDAWMHRVDITRAVARPYESSAGGGAVVEQVVRDLAQQWDGPPLVLELRGPDGGRWTLGAGEPVATVVADAVEYCRVLSGRQGDPGYTVLGDPAARAALHAARIVF